MKLDKLIKKITLTLPQAVAIFAPQKTKMIIGGRGGGKSSLQGPTICEFARQMPRASFFISQSTYAQAMTNTLPSTLGSLEKMGLYQDVDFVIGSSAGKKKGFAMPYQQPQQWNNVIHFSNGAIFQLVSQDNERSGRGLNAYGGIGDEIQGQDETKLYNSAQMTNRAQQEIFKKCSMLGTEVYTGSMPMTKKASWIFKYADKAKENPKEYLFLMFSALSNHTLRPDYFTKAKEKSPSEMVYEAEFLNIRQTIITNGFYPQLDADRHYYTDYDNNYLEGMIWMPKQRGFNKSFDCSMDNDLDKDRPLILSYDFGVFKCVTVSQERPELREYRYLKEFYAKHPAVLDDLTGKVIEYYRLHRDKTIYLYGGHDGNNKQVTDDNTLFEQIMNQFRANGWTVILKTYGAAATHNKKYYFLNTMLKGNNPQFLKIRINKGNCPNLVISLEGAEATEGTNGIEKVKKDERNDKMAQEHTTHLSDTFDIPLYTRYYHIYEENGYSTSSEGSIKIIG